MPVSFFLFQNNRTVLDILQSSVFTVLGGSGFAATLTTAQLRASKCTTVPIQEDHSNYWIPVSAQPVRSETYLVNLRIIIEYVFPVRIWIRSTFFNSIAYVFSKMEERYCFFFDWWYGDVCHINYLSMFFPLTSSSPLDVRLSVACCGTSLNSSLDYLFSDTPGTTTAFPDDVRIFFSSITIF
jgi:hypothetical protein